MSKNNKVSVIPLGGLGEIGKNMWVIRYKDEILVIDTGLMFPDEDMLGIDLVIPDITYLMENRDKVVGIILTHGHEDHIGALPYVIRQLNVPVYGSRLTLGLAEAKLKEHGLDRKTQLIPVHAGSTMKIGCFKVDFINVNHSIAGVLALAIHTPVGTIVHTADFKIDHTPVEGEPLDFRKFAELGDSGVLVLLSDSTNVEREGYTISEKVLAEKFEELFHRAEGRLIVATFASNIHRVQQVVNAAMLHGRKVAFVGRSMVNVVSIARELGYLQIPEGIEVDLDDLDRLSPHEVALVTTGSQGEPLSALSRMAMAEHRKISIRPGDTVIISASAIPGNEKLIARTINHLFKQGARVIYETLTGVHVSGHARQEELKMMLNLVKPKFFIPVHGEYRHLVQHARLAQELGMPSENVFIAENGDVLEFTARTGRMAGRVTAGRIFVDGLGVGDVGNVVLRDRKQLSQDGILIAVITMDRENGQVLAGPDIISRGFVYVRESEALMEEVRIKVKEALEKCQTQGNNDWSFMKSQIRETLSRFLYERTKRRPMILPIITEV
ncbi:MAG TPA: ribonuclease J [Firmicutes bacterium]|nr:ribonuclease J [Bacillota bacterium]